jgi:hypothetical protein
MKKKEMMIQEKNRPQDLLLTNGKDVEKEFLLQMAQAYCLILCNRLLEAEIAIQSFSPPPTPLPLSSPFPPAVSSPSHPLPSMTIGRMTLLHSYWDCLRSLLSTERKKYFKEINQFPLNKNNHILKYYDSKQLDDEDGGADDERKHHKGKTKMKSPNHRHGSQRSQSRKLAEEWNKIKGKEKIDKNLFSSSCSAVDRKKTGSFTRATGPPLTIATGNHKPMHGKESRFSFSPITPTGGRLSYSHDQNKSNNLFNRVGLPGKQEEEATSPTPSTARRAFHARKSPLPDGFFPSLANPSSSTMENEDNNINGRNPREKPNLRSEQKKLQDRQLSSPVHRHHKRSSSLNSRPLTELKFAHNPLRRDNNRIVDYNHLQTSSTAVSGLPSPRSWCLSPTASSSTMERGIRRPRNKPTNHSDLFSPGRLPRSHSANNLFALQEEEKRKSEFSNPAISVKPLMKANESFNLKPAAKEEDKPSNSLSLSVPAVDPMKHQRTLSMISEDTTILSYHPSEIQPRRADKPQRHSHRDKHDNTETPSVLSPLSNAVSRSSLGMGSINSFSQSNNNHQCTELKQSDEEERLLSLSSVGSVSSVFVAVPRPAEKPMLFTHSTTMRGMDANLQTKTDGKDDRDRRSDHLKQEIIPSSTHRNSAVAVEGLSSSCCSPVSFPRFSPSKKMSKRPPANSSPIGTLQQNPSRLDDNYSNGNGGMIMSNSNNAQQFLKQSPHQANQSLPPPSHFPSGSLSDLSPHISQGSSKKEESNLNQKHELNSESGSEKPLRRRREMEKDIFFQPLMNPVVSSTLNPENLAINNRNYYSHSSSSQSKVSNLHLDSSKSIAMDEELLQEIISFPGIDIISPVNRATTPVSISSNKEIRNHFLPVVSSTSSLNPGLPETKDFTLKDTLKPVHQPTASGALSASLASQHYYHPSIFSIGSAAVSNSGSHHAVNDSSSSAYMFTDKEYHHQKKDSKPSMSKSRDSNTESDIDRPPRHYSQITTFFAYRQLKLPGNNECLSVQCFN